MQHVQTLQDCYLSLAVPGPLAKVHAEFTQHYDVMLDAEHTVPKAKGERAKKDKQRGGEPRSAKRKWAEGSLGAAKYSAKMKKS